MSLRNVVVVLGAATLAGVTLYGMGCSSSSIKPITDAAQPDSDHVAPDTGSIDSSPPGIDAPADAPPDTSADAGLICPPGATTSFMAVNYVPAVAHQGLCSPAATQAFVLMCGDNQTNSSCQTWLDANVTGQADGGNACGDCIMAPMNNGGTWSDPLGDILANYAGCVQLTDKTHGAACAAAYNNAVGCESVACAYCPGTPTDYQSCASAIDMTSCSKYAATLKTACAADMAAGGALTTCQPSIASGNGDDDLTFIVNLICGGPLVDSGSPADTGATDTGTVVDTGTIVDTGSPSDTGSSGG